MQLVEDRQEFSDGRVRRRDYLYGAVSEKMIAGENPRDAIRRGLEEELQVSQFDISHLYDPKVTITESPSYPGLLSRYTSYEARVLLRIDEYRPEGYEEMQDDKTTYFTWSKVGKKD